MKLIQGTDERELLAGYVAEQHEGLLAAAHDLSDEQGQQRSTVSEFTLATLLAHCTAVQGVWRRSVEAAPEPAADGAGRGITGSEEMPLSEAVAALTEENERTLALIHEKDLDVLVPAPEAPWFVGVDGWTVRSVWMHLIQELGRHAGHADFLREAIDGQNAMVLGFLHRGEEVPDFLKG